MKKFAIFLISATLLISSVNLYAQTDGCKFRFVLKNPTGVVGWSSGVGIEVAIDGVNYGFLNLPWSTPSAEKTLLLPSGEIQFSWIGSALMGNVHYFEIYNSLDELIYTSPDYHEGGLVFFTYLNDCSVGINNYTASLQLYPNPTNYIVNISCENIANVKVYNSFGQLINTYHNVNSINVSSYRAGIHIFNVITNEGNSKVFKVLITD